DAAQQVDPGRRHAHQGAIRPRPGRPVVTIARRSRRRADHSEGGASQLVQAETRSPFCRPGHRRPTDALTEDPARRHDESEEHHVQHPDGKTEEGPEGAPAEEARTDADAEVGDQPISSPMHEGFGQPAGAETGQDPHRTQLYELLVHDMSSLFDAAPSRPPNTDASLSPYTAARRRPIGRWSLRPGEAPGGPGRQGAQEAVPGVARAAMLPSLAWTHLPDTSTRRSAARPRITAHDGSNSNRRMLNFGARGCA